MKKPFLTMSMYIYKTCASLAFSSIAAPAPRIIRGLFNAGLWRSVSGASWPEEPARLTVKFFRAAARIFSNHYKWGVAITV